MYFARGPGMSTESVTAGREPPPPPGPNGGGNGGGTPARKVARPFLRWIGQHVAGFYAAVGVFLLVGIALIVVCGLLFAKLADEVVEGETHAFDVAVMEWMGSHGDPRVTIAALVVTALGGGLVVWLVVLVSSVFLWVSRHRYSVLLLWVSILGAGVVSSTLKAFFDRPRPDVFEWRVPHAGQASFPSGHSMTAMVAYSTLAFLVARLETSAFLRRVTFFVAFVVIALIGMSRMYLGVHWPSDVIGGFVMGLAWAAFCALGIEALRYFRTRKPGVVDEAEQDLDAERERELGMRT